MHKVTVDQCAAYLHAAFLVVGGVLRTKTGLKVQVDRKQAPDNFPDLQRDARELGILFVSDDNSETSIYGVDGNVAFRTMHDLGHLTTGLTFSCEDEIMLALHQWEAIRHCIPLAWRERCQAVYQADTLGQTLYFAKHGHFPEDQAAYVRAVLANFE